MASMSRRRMLGAAGAGLASAVPVVMGQQRSGGAGSGKTPISLIIDDGGPVDAMFYMHPGYELSLIHI